MFEKKLNEIEFKISTKYWNLINTILFIAGLKKYYLVEKSI